jgi:CubicO group peptidase (beta-lactamase class C family)
MKTIAKILKWFIGIVVLIVLAFYITGYDYIFKGIRVVYFTGHTTAFIDDYTYFDNRSIENGNQKLVPQHKDYNSAEIPEELEKTNQKFGTVAFLIFKEGKLWYEKYYEGYGPDSQTNSFSMAKSISTLLLGKAIEDGFISSLNQKVVDFFPELKGEFADQLTVGDLSSMASGLNWNENYYSPFSMTAQSYYDENIRDLILSLAVDEKPAQSFQYLSGNTQLLGMVLEKAVGKNISLYLSENFWKPMGMEANAYWQLDSQESGMEKTYCCIASNARDFAKIGLMVMNKGKWNGKQILNQEFIEKCIQPRFEQDTEYGYGFWLEKHQGKDVFAMQGILGQYVIGIPEDDVLIVRLGHQREVKQPGEGFTSDFYDYLEGAYQMLSDTP